MILPMIAVAFPSCRKAPPVGPPPPPVVQVMEVAKQKIEHSAIFIGKLDSPQNVEVRARVESFLEKILFVEGDEVQEGAPLFELDKKPYTEKLAAAKGTLAEAQAALDKSNLDIPRLKALVAQSAIPQRELDDAMTQKQVNEANLASAEARVKTAELDLGYCDVKAPLAGRIGAKEVPVGSLVGKGEPTLLATISQIDPIWFYCSISEVDYLQAEKMASAAGRKIGDLPVKLTLADGTEHPDQGKWVFVDRVVDTTTGTIRARAEFRNTRKALRPGMFARASIVLPSQNESILVPERALVEMQGKNFVWVVDADNTASQRSVTVDPERVGPDAVVLAGLEPGERVVVEGLQKLREGAPVQPGTGSPGGAASPPELKPEEERPTPDAKAKQGKE